MIRDRSSPDEILLAFEARLRDQIPEFNERNCFVCDSPVPLVFPSSLTCTISLGDGQYPEEFQSGGGWATVTEYSSIVVTVMNRTKIDTGKNLRGDILDPDRAVLTKFVLPIIRALMTERDTDGNVLAWEPSARNVLLLRDQIKLQGRSQPRILEGREGEADYLGISLTFGISFDWRF